ncbi:MalM family protein [Halospina denitrificans]|nr:MalM family protein [Halospina denitrificans]
MRTWVDERGQVRYSPLPEKKPEREEKSPETQDTAGNEGKEKPPSHPVYNLENFPAADEVAQEDEELYYTWRDAEGRVHNTPYSLSEEKIARVSRPEKEEKTASNARVTRKDDADAPDYNPSAEAKRILGLEGAAGRLERFAGNCCSELPRIETFPLTADQGVGIRLKADSAIHRFSTGKSRFALIRLPRTDTEGLLRVQSFVRDGAFLPNLVFLDANFEPVRLVTDIAFDFSPETWSRYGFLEAFVPLREEAGERWLVIFTRERDLKGTTTITDGADGTTIVDHSPTGSLQVTIP